MFIFEANLMTTGRNLREFAIPGFVRELDGN